MAQIVVYEVAVAIAGILGMAITIYAAQSFKLRQWKFSLYYLLSGMGVFTLYQFLLAFNVVSSEYILAGLEVLFIIVMTFAIYKLKDTAETIGA